MNVIRILIVTIFIFGCQNDDSIIQHDFSITGIFLSNCGFEFETEQTIELNCFDIALTEWCVEGIEAELCSQDNIGILLHEAHMSGVSITSCVKITEKKTDRISVHSLPLSLNDTVNSNLLWEKISGSATFMADTMPFLLANNSDTLNYNWTRENLYLGIRYQNEDLNYRYG